MASGADHLDMWPYITQFKAPRFQLFSQVQRVPDFHIPFRVEMENVVREFEQFILNQSQLPLETLYWYCILKKYSFADFPETVRQKVLDIVNECEVESSEEIGFYQKKDNATPVPTIWGTFFAISIYSILDQLIPYLQMNPELKRRERLINFVMNRNQRGLFVHCLDRRCQKEKDRNFLFQTQLYALGTLDLAGYDPLSLDPKLIDVIFHKIERKEKRFALKLLILRYLGKQGDVSESDITGFFSLQKKDGGFNFVAGSVRGEIPDTFWITSALEAYRWLMDYPKGKIYSFLLNLLKKISAANSFRSELEVRDTAMTLVLLSYVWGSLIEEVEMVVFDKFSLSQTVDLDKFAEEVGLEGVEKEVIAYINAKYQFALEISDNQVNFRNTLRTMDRVHALFSKMIYERVKARPTVDLTELMASYNRDRPRKERMSIDILQEIIDTLINENYIIGKIVKKRKGVISHNILEVSRVIKRVITINVPLDNDKIEREKTQIREFEQDIENMTFEIQKSSRNIYSEVESLIIVDEVRIARQRLNSLIKNSLFDASFFNKNVEKFQSEFTYLNAKNLLRDKVLRWEQVFGDLRRNFRTIQDLLLKRIDEREKVIEEREKVEELERQIQSKIASFMERIGDFKEKAYDALKGALEPAEITNLGEKVQVIQTQLQKVDEKIAEFSQSINPQEEDMKEARKSAVDYWIAKREEIDGKMKDLLRVFKKWRAYHKRILAKKKEIVDNVLNFKESIKSAFGESGPDQAAETLDQELNGILEFLSTESQQMKQDLDADGEIFKTLPGLRLQIEREWTETQQFVEVNLNKIRAEVLVQIETARENQLQEEFNVLVDREIRYLQDLLKQTRSWLQSKLEGEQNLAIDQYRQVIQEAEREWTEKKQHIKDLQESNKTLYYNFEKNCKISIYKFDTFAKYFDQEFQQLKDQFFTDLVKQEAVQTADASEENVVDIAELAKKLEVNKKELRARMKSMLSDSILEGELLETCQIFVKTEIWVKVEKIREFVQKKIALLQDIKNQIVRLYKTSVENLTLTKTKGEIHQRIEKFDSTIKETRLQLLQKVERLNIPPQNKNYQKADAEFEAAVHENVAELAEITDNLENLDRLQQFMEEKLEFLKTMTGSQLEVFDQKISQDKSIKKVAEEFEGEVSNVRRNINAIEKEVQSYCKQVWQIRSEKDVAPILVDLKQDFHEKKSKIIERFETGQETLKERINNRRNSKLKARFEQFIDARQDLLNKTLGKMQRDIERKIETREFKAASELLTRRVADFNQLLNRNSKEIKNEATELSKTSKGFAMKNKFLLDRWNLFKQELTATVKEKVRVLEAENLENCVKLTVKAIKDEYVTFSFLSEELKMPKEVVKERLITLIGDGKIPGKLYLELEIYYENPDVLDKVDRDSLDIIKTSSFKTYLFWNRFLRLAKQYYPIFTTIAAIFTITYTLYELTKQNPLVFIIPIVLGVIMLFVVLRKKFSIGKYEEITEPKES